MEFGKIKQENHRRKGWNMGIKYRLLLSVRAFYNSFVIETKSTT